MMLLWVHKNVGMPYELMSSLYTVFDFFETRASRFYLFAYGLAILLVLTEFPMILLIGNLQLSVQSTKLLN